MLHRAIRVRRRAFATELVEAVAVLVAVVSKLFGEAAGIEVRAARAVLVNRLTVGKLRSTLVVERRQRAVGRVLEHGAEEVIGVGRAAWNVDHRLALQHFMRTGRSGRVRGGG